MVRHLLSISDIGSDDLAHLVGRSLAFARGRRAGEAPLAGRVVGIYFRGTSTRTRTSFTVGALKLGAGVVTYGPHDLQLVTGETTEDTARVLSGFLDAIVIRTNDSIGEMRAFAAQDEMAVINAMSENEHPTQAVADLATIQEEFGRLQDIHVLYLGEGNNTAAALALAAARTGLSLTIVTPEGYGVPAGLLETARAEARHTGALIEQHHDAERLPPRVDVVYTTRWQTMGVPKAEPDWRRKFWPYRVTPELMARVTEPGRTVFMHDLPAVRGEEVTDEVLDGPQSRAFRQARHKLSSAMAVLEWCLADVRGGRGA